MRCTQYLEDNSSNQSVFGRASNYADFIQISENMQRDCESARNEAGSVS